MSESLTVFVDLIKPSPYQPRLTFDLEDLKGSVLKDGILVPLTVRRKNGYFELIDGERRLRLAKELSYKTLPVTVIDVDDDTARRMVWKVNTLRKDYEPKEKAIFFQTMQKKYGMSLIGIAREYDQSIRTVKAYLNVFKLPDDYQHMVWDRVIPLGVVLELEPLFNGVEYSTPNDNPEIFIILDRAKKEKGFDFMQAREALKPYLGKLREEQVEKAKEALAEVKPEVSVPESAEELERAAQTLKQEAKRKREAKLSPEEKAKRETEKQRKAEERKRKQEEKKRKEEEKRRLREEQIRREAEKEAKEKVLENPSLLKEAAQKYVETERSKTSNTKHLLEELGIPSVSEQIEQFYEKASQIPNEPTKTKLTSHKDLINHILGIIEKESLKCPICGEPHIVWRCGHDF